MKECFKCKESKPLSEFYKHPQMGDGYLGKCKECAKRDSRAQGTDKEYDRKRNVLPHRVAAREAYAKTEAGKRARIRGTRAYRLKYPAKTKARNMVGNAVRDGKLFREPCGDCGAEKAHAHHDDYAKPLNVRWLCPAHHREWHKENGPGVNG